MKVYIFVFHFLSFLFIFITSSFSKKLFKSNLFQSLTINSLKLFFISSFDIQVLSETKINFAIEILSTKYQKFSLHIDHFDMAK